MPINHNRKVSIRDIAEYCHVSPSTVSRVMNGNNHISKETQKRVMDIATAWGYVPNESAKNLRMRTSRLVGIFVNTLDYGISSIVMSRLHDRLAEKDFASIICNIGANAEKEEHYYQMMLSMNACAIFMIVNHSDSTIDFKSAIPLIYVYRYPLQTPTSPSVCRIETDNYGAGYQAGRELLRLGCRHIAEVRLISSDNRFPLARHLGLLQSLYDCDVTYEESLSIVSDQNDYGVILEKINQKLDELPAADGYFCSSDHLALALMEALVLHHYRIPEDVRIIGCNDMLLPLHIGKPISSIRHRIEDICRAAIEMMERLSAGEKLAEDGYRQIFETDFIPRATT
ncbi:MAG: LacI family transcriptional regulator [Roseburia sp.]|nr:LacI family transcriptional regulator [Roseburia sp.]MCM1098211.1 LacI family transcriptional regulator [Ruminococcus flavefaciens]